MGVCKHKGCTNHTPQGRRECLSCKMSKHRHGKPKPELSEEQQKVILTCEIDGCTSTFPMTFDGKGNAYRPKVCSICSTLWNRYRIRKPVRDKLYEDNNMCCHICNSPVKFSMGSSVSKVNACVDHCHITNEVRGILCGQCNVGLGNFKDNETYLINAIKYLRMNKKEMKK